MWSRLLDGPQIEMFVESILDGPQVEMFAESIPDGPQGRGYRLTREAQCDPTNSGNEGKPACLDRGTRVHPAVATPTDRVTCCKHFSASVVVSGWRPRFTTKYWPSLKQKSAIAIRSGETIIACFRSADSVPDWQTNISI